MAAPADAIFVDGEVHVRPGEERTEEAIAVRDGTVCRVADTYEVEFLEGIETRRVDLNGRTVVPGFVDGYADLTTVGRRLQESGTDGDPLRPQPVEKVRERVTAAVDAALEQGLTTVFDAVRHPETARAYHELDLADELPIRVRLHYRGDLDPSERPAPLDAARRLGLVSGVGTDRLQIESLGLAAGDRSAAAVRDFLEEATEAGFRVSATAVDAAALDTLLSEVEGSNATGLRIWLGEAVPETQVERLADLGITVVGRPGPAAQSGDTKTVANEGVHSQGPQFGRLVAAGGSVAFGSNGGRPAPLRDIERATGASPPARLGMTEALRAATGGAGGQFAEESRLGTLEVGTPADFVGLSASPWETPIAQLDVEMTVVDGSIEYDRRD